MSKQLMRNLLARLFVIPFIALSLTMSSMGYAQQYDRQYLKWKEEQEAKDASLAKTSPNYYLSKPSTTQPSKATTSNGSKVKLNSASLTELQTLDGIGEKKAVLIVEYRQKNGGFKTIDDLKNVKGIGPKLFEKNRSRLAL